MGYGASITVSRLRGRWWFASQPFKLELDGVIVGKLTGGEEMTIEVDPGEHLLRVNFRLAVWSNRLRLSVPEGESRLVSCKTNWAGYPSIDAI